MIETLHRPALRGIYLRTTYPGEIAYAHPTIIFSGGTFVQLGTGPSDPVTFNMELGTTPLIGYSGGPIASLDDLTHNYLSDVHYSATVADELVVGS